MQWVCIHASRTQYVEVLFNGNYEAVYVFMEKVKRDKGRICLAKLRPDEITGDELTVGYLLK